MKTIRMMVTAAALGCAMVAMAAANTADQDKQFLAKASMGGNGDIALSKLAILKGSDDVKKLAKRIVDDHTAMSTSMMPQMQRLGVQAGQALSSKDQAEFQKLNSLTGQSFDQEYISYLVVDHREDATDFSKEASATGDKDLRVSVKQGLAMIRHHLLLLENVAKADGMPIPRA